MGDIYRLLAEQRIREYDLRLRHIDELLVHAEKKAGDRQEDGIGELLDQLRENRAKLACWLEETKCKPPENWREDEIMKAGPMGIWDAIAQQMDRLVERLER